METKETLSDENISKKLTDDLFRLKRLAFKLTGDKCKADDLLQETSVKILYNAGSFVYNSNFKGWSATIMHNIFMYERTRSSRFTTVTDDINLENEHHYCIVDIEDFICAIDSLPTEYRKVFTLYADGYKYHEIARRLNLPLGTVKSRIHTARTRLQELLKDYVQ